MIDENKLIEEINDYCSEFDESLEENESFDGYNIKSICMSTIADILDLIRDQPKVGEWIHFTKRPCDEEEKEMYGGDEMLDCPLPEHEQEIIVTDGEYVWIDTFMYDDTEGGCYLDSGNEMIGLAWMTKPEPFKGD